MKPQAFINPKFQADQKNSSAKEWKLRRGGDSGGPLRWGSKQALSQTRHAGHKFKSYDEFTKTYDKSELNTKLREMY